MYFLYLLQALYKYKMLDHVVDLVMCIDKLNYTNNQSLLLKFIILFFFLTLQNSMDFVQQVLLYYQKYLEVQMKS